MDALIDRMTDTILEAAKEIGANKSIPVNERMIRVVMALNISGGNGKEIMEHIHKPQNALMHQKNSKKSFSTMCHLFWRISFVKALSRDYLTHYIRTNAWK